MILIYISPRHLLWLAMITAFTLVASLAVLAA
jgi:hypothetical protein